eukprot:8079442-Pyramimonas_sp.AAC.1
MQPRIGRALARPDTAARCGSARRRPAWALARCSAAVRQRECPRNRLTTTAMGTLTPPSTSRAHVGRGLAGLARPCPSRGRSAVDEVVVASPLTG